MLIVNLCDHKRSIRANCLISMESLSYSGAMEAIPLNCKYFAEQEFADNFSSTSDEDNMFTLYLNVRSLTKIF